MSLAREEGRSDVPQVLSRFRRNAEVYFLDERGNRVHFDRVAVVWED